MEETGLKRDQISSVLDELKEIIRKEIVTGDSFSFLSLLKITKKVIPEKPERIGKNPFTGEEYKYPSKPAHNVIKIKPLKALKEMV
jgi:nucleoid DNA-binding protein